MEEKASNRLLSQDFFETFFKEFLTNEGASKKTVKNYLSDLRHFLSWLTTHSDLSNLTIQTIKQVKQSHISAYITYLTQDHKTTTGVRRLSSLKTFFRACQKDNHITINPAQEYIFTQQQSKATKTTKQLELVEWELIQLRQGNQPQIVKQEINHIKDFAEWINKYRNGN